MKKTIINPLYSNLSTFVDNVSNTFKCEGETIYKARNEVKYFEYQGIEIAVKKYGIPILINRIIYSTFRASKAKRAYQYALKLIELGFHTPAPIAYVEFRHFRLFSDSYFIYKYEPSYQHIRSFLDYNGEDKEALFTAFAKYTAKLHEKGVFHQDYSPGNILYKKEGDLYYFSLIDINRMKFCKVTEEMAYQPFVRLEFYPQTTDFLARIYARERGFEENSFAAKAVKLAKNY